MERSGPSIEIKIVLLVAVALVVHDGVLLAMYVLGAEAKTIQLVLGGVLILALVVAAVWGSAIARAIRRLTGACYAARKGDHHVLTRLPRTDELAELNSEINELVVLLRESERVRLDLSASRTVTDAVATSTPDIMRASHELLISLKELREGAAAEVAILRKAGGSLDDARRMLGEGRAGADDIAVAEEVSAKLKSLDGLARELELLGDEVVDEVTRTDIDEGALARAVNGMRDAARTMADVAGQAARPLERRQSDAEAVAGSGTRLAAADAERIDGSRVAELMERSAASGLGAATRLASSLRRLGLVLEAYEQRRRSEDSTR